MQACTILSNLALPRYVNQGKNKLSSNTHSIIPGHQKVFCKIKQLAFFFFNAFKNFMEKKFKPPFCRKGWKKIIFLSYCYTQEALTHPHAIITSSNGQLLHKHRLSVLNACTLGKMPSGNQQRGFLLDIAKALDLRNITKAQGHAYLPAWNIPFRF